MTIKKTEIFDPVGDRYQYDFNILKQGWSQVDTKQDASYFGTWANPHNLSILTFCEGDTTFTECETLDEFQSEMRKLKGWNADPDRNYWIGVDSGLEQSEARKWVEIGLGDLLHENLLKFANLETVEA